MSDEDFFPQHSVFSAISNLRLRVANGASGVQPGPNDALRTYSANSASIKNTDTPIETFNAIGNDSLKPERSTEWETGFDSQAVRQPHSVRRHVLLADHARRADQRRHRAVARLGRDGPAREPRLGQERRAWR